MFPPGSDSLCGADGRTGWWERWTKQR
jgi:hypothetical protein